MCDQAFTEREFAGIWGLEQVTTVTHGSKYKTKPLHKALQESLGTEALFGGERERNPEYPIKVAVTSTSGTGREGLVISNYYRREHHTEPDPYTFVRCDSPEVELTVCEAAAATSAAPGYFKEFFHKATGRAYLDGALHNNNPVHVANREWKLLWPDTADAQPDLLLSIGTGTNAKISEQASGGLKGISGQRAL